MDRDQFDTLARLVWTKRSRRTALGALLGALVLGSGLESAAKGKGKHKRKRKQRQRRNENQRPCYPGTDCIPGQGRDNAGCDFSGSTHFFEGDFHGSDFAGANFTGAQLAGAKLHGADLGGACLVGAILLDAELDGADLDGAVFCRTLMPDGTINDSGCGQGTRCCPTPELTCPGGVCGPGTCVNTINDACFPLFGLAPCCASLECVIGLGIVPACQKPCDNDQDCTDVGTQPFVCRPSTNCVQLQGFRCCQPPGQG